MCQLISGLWRGRGVTVEVSVSNWLSHSESQRITGYTEAAGWYEMHYTLDGEIVCRTPDGRDAAAEAEIKRRWPTVATFMRWAIAAGADVKAVDKDGWTALHLAAWFGNADCVKLLLKAGADVKAVDKDGWTARNLAARAGHADCVKLLKAAEKQEAQNGLGKNA